MTVDAPLKDAIERFKNRSVKGTPPVVDEHGYLHGAIYESDVGNYLFDDYGSALLSNNGMHQTVGNVVRRCPISEAHVGTEARFESYVISAGNEGLVLTVEGRYFGYLSNNALLTLASAREVEVARDQNPLTQLPGNASIKRNVESLLASAGRCWDFLISTTSKK